MSQPDSAPDPAASAASRREASPLIVTGHQPAYLPWLGLFHKIALADIFIFMDDVQFLTRDWNHRNRIKNANGPQLLTVPVRRKDSPSDRLCDLLIDDSLQGKKQYWQTQHWKAFQNAYSRAPFWSDHAPFLENLYCEKPWQHLAALNRHVLDYCLDVLGLKTKILVASEVGFTGQKADLVLDHCRQTGADLCVMGAMGSDYVDPAVFQAAGVMLYFQDYQHPEYPQRYGAFESHLSLFDLLLNCGPDSLSVLMSGNLDREGLISLYRNEAGPVAGANS